MSQGELGDAASLARMSIYRIEVGRQDPTLSVLQRLAEGLDMPLVSLIQEAQRPRKTGKSPKARSKKGRKP